MDTDPISTTAAVGDPPLDRWTIPRGLYPSVRIPVSCGRDLGNVAFRPVLYVASVVSTFGLSLSSPRLFLLFSVVLCLSEERKMMAEKEKAEEPPPVPPKRVARAVQVVEKKSVESQVDFPLKTIVVEKVVESM